MKDASKNFDERRLALPVPSQNSQAVLRAHGEIQILKHAPAAGRVVGLAKAFDA
jgi:hypothetical protein